MNRVALETQAHAPQQSPARAREHLPLIDGEDRKLIVFELQPAGGSMASTLQRCNALDWSIIPPHISPYPPGDERLQADSYYIEQTILPLVFPFPGYRLQIGGFPVPPGGESGVSGPTWQNTLSGIIHNSTMASAPLANILANSAVLSFWLRWQYFDSVVGAYREICGATRSKLRTSVSFACRVMQAEIYGTPPSITMGTGQIGVRNPVQVASDYVARNHYQDIAIPDFDGSFSLGAVRFLVPDEVAATWAPLPGLHFMG